MSHPNTKYLFAPTNRHNTTILFNLKAVLLLFLLFVANSFSAQSISGVVLDEKKAPIAFATLLLDGDPARGTIADIDGKFKMETLQSFASIVASSIGYETKEISLHVETTDFLTIILKEKAYELQQAVVVAGENPAHQIIRRAVVKKEENNPERLTAYSCNVYNKLIGDFFKPELSIDTERKKGKIRTRMDSLFLGRSDYLLSINEEKHIFLMESLVERKFKAHRHLLENILNNRISGLKSPTFSAIIHSLQPFAFYENYVQVLDKKFLNPLSPNSESQYFFNLVDTLYQGQDSIFVITFTPRDGKIFDGLKGVLNIHTSNYALQTIKAKPATPGAMKLSLEQLYDRVDGHWFPIQLNITIEADKYPSRHLGTKFSGKSYIDQIKINPPLRGKDFPLDGVAMAKDNANRSDSLWTAIRTIPLSDKEGETYQWLDSLGAKNNIDKKLKILDALVQGFYRLGPVNWDIFRSFKSNPVEGFRPGLRLVTNDVVAENIKFGAYAGYGLRDGRWKYKGDIEWTLFPAREGALNAFYSQETREPGRFELDQPGELLTSRVYSNRLDLLENYGLGFSIFFLPYTHGSLHIEKQRFQPTYFYSYLSESTTPANTFDITEIGLKVRFAFAEKFTEIFGTRMRTKSAYPSVQLDVRQGVSAFSGDYEYLQIKSSVEGTFRLGRLGWSSFAVYGGYASGELPLPKLFSTSGLGNEFGFLIDDFGFRTMSPYEFLSDRFAFLFFKQELGRLLNVRRFFRPIFSIEHNMGWGSLRHRERHVGQPFRTMERGFYETGMVVDNILSLNYFSLGYIGLGVGAWYRYGPLQRGAGKENWGVKVTLNFDVL